MKEKRILFGGGGTRPLCRFTWIRHCVLLRSPFLSADPAILTHVTMDTTLLSNAVDNGHQPDVLRQKPVHTERRKITLTGGIFDLCDE